MPFNSIFSWIVKKRIHQIELFKKFPLEVQNELFQHLISFASDTEYGKKYQFHELSSYQDFKEKVPLTFYDDLKPFIDRVIEGEQSVLWPTTTKWFAKSSGTTSSKSKLIPVTRESLEDCHYKGGKDLLSIYYNNYENRKLYNGKHLIVGGSAQVNHLSEDSYFGDLSAIIVKNLPWWAEIKRTPAKEITLMNEWEEKLEKMAQSTIDEDVYIIAGVPSWTMVLIKRVLEITGKKTLKEVWPNLELYMHGGVSFEPYRYEFEKLIGFDDMHYVETYNASEGFFGIQDEINNDGLLLMLDYGIFYEFIPMKDFQGTSTLSENVVSLEDVKVGENYALVISTNGGLWRYIVGDTIVFTELKPYRFKISGRTKSYINTFGEEVVVENAEKAIASASKATSAQVRDYHACPIYMDDHSKGGHLWLIEFITEPSDLKMFQRTLDHSLKDLNSDYEAKRYKDMILQEPTIKVLPVGSFDLWLKSNNKLGGQNKVPRLANNREISEQILQCIIHNEK
ncbi:MAG: GH3 auxin-responsive promoter family protein [Crocinitomicaceae bacterium]|nr:GH3 auxin-responsive promoter family protein [Crocinitomicaceae bacterium]